jgi:hypothetical protein
MAYWTAAGGYSGAAPQPNLPNGAWWFLKAYSGMTGQTVRVDSPHPSTVDTLQGIASIDPARRTAQILAGGTVEDFLIAATGLDHEFWGGRVTATVYRIDWTGYEGASAPPVPIAQVVGDPASLEVPVYGPDRMAAYWITITPGEAAVIGPPPWKGQWDAEAADITSGEITRHGHADDGNAFAASGEHDVCGLGLTDSAVVFQVDVPEAGEYDLAVFYSHMYGRGAEATEPQPAQQVLTVNGAERFLDYPSTMNWGHRSIARVPLTLRAGANTVELSKSGAIGTARGEVALDKIELTERRGGRVSYDAAFARAQGDALVFDLYAAEAGYHRIEGADTAILAGPQNQEVLVDLARPVYLHAGVNRLRTEPITGPILVAPATGPRPAEVDAAEVTRTGGSCLVVNDFAHRGHVIGWNGRGATAAIEVEADGGPHVLLVSYANGERGEGHEYNIDIVTRHCGITVNGKDAGTYPMRGTWTWNDFWTYPVILDLAAGPNTIVFANPDGPTAEFERFRIAPLNP